MPITFETDMDWIYFVFQPTDDDGNIVDSEGNLIPGIVDISEEEVIDGTNDRATIIRAPDALSGYVWERLEDVLYNGVPVIRYGLTIRSKIRALSFASRYWYFDPEIVSTQNKYSVLIKQKGKAQVIVPAEKKSITTTDVLPLTDPKLLPTTLNLIPLEEDYTVQFILLEVIGTDRLIHWYDIDGNLIRTLNVNDFLGTGFLANDRMHIISASADMNTLMVYLFVNDWRGYISTIPGFSYSNYYPVKIPLEAFTPEEVPRYDLKGILEFPFASSYNLSLGGTQEYIGSIATNVYHQVNVKYLMADDPYCMVYLPGLQTWEYDWEDDWPILVGYPASYNGKFLICVTEFNDSDPDDDGHGWVHESFIGIWDEDSLQGNRSWYTDPYFTGGFLDDVLVKIPLAYDNNLSQEPYKPYEYNSLMQVLCYDNKIYAFFRPQSIAPYTTTFCKIKVFDFSGNLLQEKTMSVTHHGRVDLIRYLDGYVFCYRDYIGGAVSEFTDAHFLDPVSLEVIKVITLPHSSLSYSFITVNRPISKYMLTQVNELRSIQSPIARVLSGQTYFQPVGYLGYSRLCEIIALNHLTWCAANCRLTHEDANGDLVGVRAKEQGIWVAGENLAYIPVSTINQEIDVCMAGWIASPGHKATMCQFEHVMMGYASIRLPVSCTALTLGSGLYTGSGYTTEETVVEIPVSQRGKIRLYCQVFAGG